MSYIADKKPGELTALTTLATDDVFVVGDTSDASEVAKGITKANLITDLSTSFSVTGHNHTGVYAPVLGADDNYVTDAEKIVIGNTSGTNTGDNAVNSNYSGLVTNATHTGDAEGATSLTVKRINGTALSGLATGVLKNTTTTGVPFISKVAITEPATGSTLTIADGQTLTVNGSATITNGTHSGTNTGDNTVATALTGTPSITVATVTTTGNIELGHASDTTLSRVSAGVVAVEGVTVPTISSTNTLTNKRVTKRVGTTTSSATPTINTDNYDIYSLTAQTEAITSFTTNLSGTPTDGQTLMIQITGTAARAITWGASFEASTVALPTTTVTTARLDVGFIWNTVTSKWRCIAAA